VIIRAQIILADIVFIVFLEFLSTL
jgi:hypothetical protein